MAGSPRPPPSPTLLPPRKSVELEDPGAHELSGSENEDDHFSDAQESRQTTSRPSSPIPTTRVEKVDDSDRYGEVPGTPAYKLREHDAVPDEVEIVGQTTPDRSKSHTPTNSTTQPLSPKIPTTVVEKIDPSSPSHGEVPGTPAHAKRMADAVPDVVRPVGEPESGSSSEEDDFTKQDVPGDGIPTTIITKVDSGPSHGEVPGTEAYDKRRGDAQPDAVEKRGDVKGVKRRSLHAVQQYPASAIRSTSPIAADGGFGPMVSDDSDESDVRVEPYENAQGEEMDKEGGFGDDFDDFEAGEEDEDFGDFDPGLPIRHEEERASDLHSPPSQPILPIESHFPLLDFSDLESVEDIEQAAKEHLDALFPSTKEPLPDPPPLPSDHTSIFMSDRSLSLWSQLVAPPPLQPPNWVRSRIRRLFLVSLGVPIDLDEILPASKQKKLVLPSTNFRGRSESPAPGRQTGSKVHLKHDNESSTSVDKPSTKSTRRKKGIATAPEIDLQAAKLLCTTTEAALSNMTVEELTIHVRKLENLTSRASEVLEYWLKRRDSALGDKEAFEGVIENLVKHARRVRK